MKNYTATRQDVNYYQIKYEGLQFGGHGREEKELHDRIKVAVTSTWLRPHATIRNTNTFHLDPTLSLFPRLTEPAWPPPPCLRNTIIRIHLPQYNTMDMAPPHEARLPS